MPAEQYDEELPRDLTALEVALRQLTPSIGQLNRDRLMYLAGQASISNFSVSPRESVAVRSEVKGILPSSLTIGRIAWPSATAALLLISLTLGGFLIFGEQGGERIVVVDRPAVMPSPSAAATIGKYNPPEVTKAAISAGPNYFELRDLVSTKGLDAISMPEAGDEKSALPDPLTWPALRNELFRGKIGG